MSTRHYDKIDLEKVERAAFKYRHNFLGHPALELENLERVLPSLPKDQVMYSKNLLGVGDDFETTFRTRPEDRSVGETIETIRTSNSYIMVASPERHPSFQPIFKQLLDDVEHVTQQRGVGNTAYGAKLYLFIASPNSITPFHIDRNSTFLLQFRGSKQISVFPQWDARVVTPADTEAYFTNEKTALEWSAEKEPLGEKFDFQPGDALHIPFTAGHHVKNGPDDVSISMSIIFNTKESAAWGKALRFNHALRPFMTKIGLRPKPVGGAAWRDAGKAYAWSIAGRTSRLLNRA